MAIANLFGRGIGFNNDIIGWITTHGYGAFTIAGDIAGAGIWAQVHNVHAKWTNVIDHDNLIRVGPGRDPETD